MKTHYDHPEVTISGAQETAIFTMEASAASFHVMSDSLYPDKIKAVIRELSCNAYDSHVMADCVDIPFEVHLPGTFDLMFHVRDFGTGLSHTDVMGLYSTYFKSTKTKCNLVIGQLGLGSKSPYSYAHTFNVESWFNGEKRTYVCYKNDEGMPAITLMHTEETSEPNGLKVSLAVRASDIAAFINAAKKVFAPFIVQPIITGVDSFAPYAVTHSIRGSNDRWKIREYDESGLITGATITQGNVMYPIDAEQLKEAGLASVGHTVASCNIDLRMPIGSVEVAPSRESLSYNRRTLATLVAEFNRIGQELESSFESRIAECKSTWELYIFYQSMIKNPSIPTRNVFNVVVKAKELTWNGIPINSKFIVDMRDITDVSLICVETREVKQQWKNRHAPIKVKTLSTTVWQCDKSQFLLLPGTSDLVSAWTFDVTPHTHIIVNDTGKRANAGDIKDFLINQQKIQPKYTFVLIEPSIKDHSSVQDTIELLVARINAPSVLMLSDIPRITTSTVKQQKVRVKREKTSKLVWNKFERKNALINWTVEQIDMANGGFYIPIIRYSTIQSHIFDYSIDKCIVAATELKLIPSNVKLIGFTSDAIAKLPIGHNWINMFDHIATVVNAGHQTSGQYFDVRMNNYVHRMISSPIAKVIESKRTTDLAIVSGEFKNILDDIDRSLKPVDHSMIDALNTLHRFLNLSMGDVTDVYAVELSNRWHDMITKYDILTILDWTYTNNNKRPTYNQLIDYVNLVDSNRVGVTTDTVEN